MFDIGHLRVEKIIIVSVAVSEANRNSLRGSKFQKFPWGACPPDPSGLGVLMHATHMD